MRPLFYPLGAMLLWSVLAVHASDDMKIYSGRFDNGWGDSWSWMPRYSTNNPVHTGSNSMALVPSSQWQAWWLKAGTGVDTTIYTNLTFWLYGSTSGQTVLITGELNGSGAGLPTVSVTALANTWQQFNVSLVSLGVNNKTNLTGFQIGNGTTTQPRYIDDVRLVAAPAPATVHVNINANQTVRTVDGKVFGINQVGWDSSVNTPSSVATVNDIGGNCLRWPGGSWGDGWHWTNDTSSVNFIALATNTHSQGFIIANYGSSDASEAAYGVRMLNVTNHCNFKYWEIGNEVGGSWEWDHIDFFTSSAIANLNSFASKIYTPTNGISWFIRTNLSSSTLVTLTNYINTHNNAATLTPALISDLNSASIVDRSSIYSASRFVGVALRPETQTNLNYGLPDLGASLINRMLIEDSYPTELTRQTNNILLPNAFLPHDPWTYAMRFTNYYAQMKAADPTIKIGAVADVFEDGTVNYANHPVVNPRTGLTQNGWTPVMLAYLRSNNCTPDFLIEHNYGPTAGDTQDLLYSRCWASHAASLRQMLTDYLGSAGTNVTLEVTECGMGGDKQNNSLPGGLFYADSLGQIMQTEFNSRLWWDMRNGINVLGESDPAFYGWRTNGSGNFISDAGIIYGAGGGSSSYPTYYCAKLIPHFAKDGDTVVSATSDYELLSVYSVKRTNGALTLLVINKSSASSLTANFNLSGYQPYTNATVYSYGIPQDTAAETGIGSPDIAQTNFTGAQSSFTATFAPFSATVMVLSPGNQPPFTPDNLAATASNAAVALTWDTAAGADSYIVKRSTTSGSGYTTVATGVTATSYLDPGLVNGTTYYYVVAATNTYGRSADSAEASATPTDTKALYAFEGNAQDSSGSANHGTATSLSYVTGKVGAQAAQFNGTSSYVSIPRSITDDFTVAMWVKTTDTLGSAGAQWWSGKGLVDGEVGGGGADWGTAIVNGKFVLGVGSVSSDTTLASSVNINDGIWHHVAATRNNASGAIAVYVDGILRGSGTGSTGSRTFPPSLRIGSLQTGNNFLNGMLDDVRLYDRILTVGEIAALIAQPATPTNLVATIGDATVALSWSASSNAASYYVKRSLTSGSGYTSVATNTSLTFINNGLSNGTLYYFVVSGVNTFGESTNSAQVSARPTSSASVAIGATSVSGQLQLSWPTDHTGWQLQAQTNNLAVGLGTNWVNVSGSDQTNQISAPLNPANNSVFYRLVSP